MKKLYTIGYEGADLSDFLLTLKRAKARVLLDIREIPISRRKGFSKTALRNALTEVGIDYRHERQLGSPKQIRHRLREDLDYKRFFRDFDRHLSTQGDLLTLLTQELKGNVVLMCYEKDHTECHRSSVVNELADMLGLEPVHLNVEHNHDRREASQAAYSHLGKGLSPA